ncbi:aminotransferase class I/II-fold pyridoxal phosphate-dependent enzyme [Halobacillus sp. Marseille-Q1614]|uniref:aminotransferase class I/II-fold pyridoxal phosphate-dependent enzyme n=1 Tax=Halobacillus sp. Marseille-Q1614 TaxID=2709134 RepID=UPI00156EEBE7|nr:aminotransferase class I/II-fold pyridoxal phosphate-dependent enzyme [Halobacillus sp. Marseille-Q1614]
MKYGSKQVNSLPPYLFSVFHQKKKKLQEKGVDVIDLGIGAPDLPTPSFIIQRLSEEARKPSNHKYSPYGGCSEFRQAVASFYKRHYDVSLDPDTEVLALIGSKEGIAHMISAVLDPGDGVLVPDPGYPVYQSAIHLAYGSMIPLPLDEAKGYVPQFDELSDFELADAKLMLLNYPSNPTGGTVDLNAFKEAVEFARRHQLLVVQDAAYDLVTFGGYKAPSILQVPGAKDISVEFGSLSKSFNMTGWRIGYVVGNKELIQALSIVKSNMDTSQFLAIQKAAAAALTSDFSTVKANNAVYEERMGKLLPALEEIGMKAARPKGTFFLWAKVPDGYTSQSFSQKILEEAGVILTPGTAFGAGGEGYVRLSLSVPSARLEEAACRMRKIMKGGSAGEAD